MTMNYNFTLDYPEPIFALILLLLLLCWYRWFKWRPVYYPYALTTFMLGNGVSKSSLFGRRALFCLRSGALGLLIISLGRPQLIDSRSKIRTNGIDVILALDVSNSMQLFDNPKDPKPRLEIAKEEAQKFISHRDDDLIGIVLFARQAVSRCPLILDKVMLKSIIDGVQVGVLDSFATMLTVGLMAAINRLKHSRAHSKVIILLTDGQPSPGDLDYKLAIEIAKKLQIKIYTIGVGSTVGGYGEHPFLGVIRMPGDSYNPKLLQQIAQETGGRFFQAQDQLAMRAAYNQINQLEKVDHQAPIYAKKIELFGWFLSASLALLLLELGLSYWVWFGLA